VSELVVFRQNVIMAAPSLAPPAFHVLAKPTGAFCNLDCKYCFYLDKERLYPGSDFRMPDAVAESYVRQLLEAHRAPQVTIAWQGGEPTLMGLDFFRRTVERAAAHRKRGTTIQHTIQTNGVLLDDQWCGFLREQGYLVGLSLDGPREMHDAYRVDKGGQPTFERVMRALHLLQKHGVEHNILTTVHAANAAHPREVYRFLRDNAAARFIQLIPIVERVPGPALVTARSVRPKDWGAFLIEIFDEWVRRDVGRVFVQTFDAALGSWLGAHPGLCLFAETCGDAVALEHNGDLYSCDHFVDPAHHLGNILETPLAELVGSPRQRRFGLDKRDRLPRYCRECEVRFACNGECPKNRFIETPDGEAGLNYLCAGYRRFFNHVDPYMQRMAALIRERRPPSGITAELSRAPALRRRADAPRGARTPRGTRAD
jgi:uncharacterized protein